MNYLAHVFLSCNDDKLLLGNLIADFIKNKDLIDFDKALIKGVELHRVIDSFTDSNPYFLASSRKFYNNHHKYAPVLTDILYDYLLVKNWDQYSEIPLNSFVKNVYDIILRNTSLLPNKLRDRLIKMLENNFLMFSASKEGLQRTFEYMDKRTKFPSNFTSALQDLEVNYDFLDLNFNRFFPKLINHVEAHCSCNTKSSN